MRTPLRARPTIRTIAVLAIVALSSMGCEEIDGRNRTRQGNRLFRETKFIDAVAEYEAALKTVDHPIVHYNAALAYSKVFKAGEVDDVRLGVKGSFVCNTVPNTKTTPAQVCVKPFDRRFDDCDEKNVCASSYKCEKVELCTLTQAAAADAAASHFEKWLEKNAKDDETRTLMTKIWLDSDQYQRATDYWMKLLTERPNDTRVMGILAGIRNKAGDWRSSIDWYRKVADQFLAQREAGEAAKAQEGAVSALTSIGNVAYHKLMSKSLTGPDHLELCDAGIGALTRAAELSPKLSRTFSLLTFLYNQRALVQGESIIGNIERATGQDLSNHSIVLAKEAKKAAEAAAAASGDKPAGAGSGAPAPTQTPTPNPAPKAGG